VYLEKNCHHFDIFNWMVGQNVKPRKISAFGGQNVLKMGSKRPVELLSGEKAVIDYSETIDNFWCMVEYENDVRCSMGLSFFCPQGKELKLGLIGDTGKIDAWEHQKLIQIWNQDSKPANLLPQGQAGTEWAVNAQPQRYFVHYGSIEQWENFHKSVLTRKKPFCDILKARDSARLALAAEKSMVTGNVVTF